MTNQAKTTKPPLSELPKGYDTLTYVTPEIDKRFPLSAKQKAAGVI